MAKKTAALLLAVLICAFAAGCTGQRVETGPQLAHNVARMWFPKERVSRFVLDGRLIDGEAAGQAFMDVSADGRTGIAWVDTAAYFVDETGVRPLGTGISTAVVSFDGKYALYHAEGELRMMAAGTGEYTVIETGLASVQQIAASPATRSVLFTATYENDGVNRRTMLYSDGSLTPVYEGRSVMALAVSDDASLRFFYDFEQGAFCVDRGGEEKVVSTGCDSNTNYNFTNDLSEVAFRIKDGVNYLYRVDGGILTELGPGFDYTLKTDVYSMSTTTLIAYINDVQSFLNGLWLVRSSVEGVYVYGVGRLTSEGELEMLVENASDYKVGGGRIAWLGGGRLYSTDMRGKTRELASDVTSFVLSDDGTYVYYISNAGSLFGIKGTGKPKKLDSNVSDCAQIGDTLFYIKDAEPHGTEKTGELCRLTALGSGESVMHNAAAFDKRWGQLMVYAYPPEDGSGEPRLETDEGFTACRVYFTADGAELTLLGEGVER